MIIINQNATAALIRDLERARGGDAGDRCIHLKLSGLRTRAEDWIDDVSTYLDDVIEDGKCRIFLCEDGDVFMIAPTLTRRKLSEVFLCVFPHLKPAPDPQGLAFLYELNRDANALLVIAQAKMDVMTAAHQKAHAEKQKAEQEKMDRQKRAILNLTITPEMRRSIEIKRATHEKPTVLLIDDDAFSRKIVSNALGETFTIHTGGDGWQAITHYLREAPDIVFLDIEMPDVNGHEILGKIFDLDPAAYVVMLSGYGHQDNIVRAIQRGAKGFIGKPFTRDKLFHYIHQCPSIQTRKQKVVRNA